MWLFSLFLACASEPESAPPVPEDPPEAAETPEAAEVPKVTLLLRVRGPAEMTCRFEDGTVAHIAVTSRWPVTADFRIEDDAVEIGPETPGYAPYEYTGDVVYTWSLKFEALDADWMYSLNGLAPEEPTPRLARTRAGVTDLASCG